jgi:uncharacterized membrane protein YebE (DUF533 family)
VDVTRLLTSLLGGVLTTRPKKSSQLSRYLGGGSSSVFNPRNVLTAGALGWAAYEIWRTHAGRSAAPAGQPVVAGTTVIPSTPPPVPSAAPASASSPPPLPATPGEGIEPTRRLVGVLLGAARADGKLGEAEYGKLLKIAREAGGESLVGEELRAPTPLEKLAAGIPEPYAREDLYRLAYGIVRCDEGVEATERTWLARLSSALGLDPDAVARLEREVAQAIRAN